MEDKYLVGMDEYKVLDKDNPIGYTRDIHCCIVLLMHRDNSTVLLHIESFNDFIEIAKT